MGDSIGLEIIYLKFALKSLETHLCMHVFTSIPRTHTMGTGPQDCIETQDSMDMHFFVQKWPHYPLLPPNNPGPVYAFTVPSFSSLMADARLNRTLVRLEIGRKHPTFGRSD